MIKVGDRVRVGDSEYEDDPGDGGPRKGDLGTVVATMYGLKFQPPLISVVLDEKPYFDPSPEAGWALYPNELEVL